MRGGACALFVGLLSACGSRTLPGGVLGESIGGAGGPDAGLDGALIGPDGAPLSDAPFMECQAGPPTPTWTVPVASNTDNPIGEVYAVTVADDGSIFAAGCGLLTAPRCPDTPTNGAGPCFLVKLAEDGHVLFENRFTDGLNDPLIIALVADNQGGVLVGVEDDEGTDLVTAGGSFGCIVARFDGAGHEQFAHTVGGTNCITGFAFAADKEGTSVIAAGCGDSYLCNGQQGSLIQRLDGSGALTGSRTIAGANLSTIVGAVALQSDGTLFVGGYGQSTVDFGSGPQDLGTTAMFMATYDSSLNLQHVLSVTNHGTNMQAVATLDGSGFVVAGEVDRPNVDLGGGPLAYTPPQQDVFLARMTKSLGHVFSHGFGDLTTHYSQSLCLDPDGTIGWNGTNGETTDFGNGKVVSGVPTVAQDGFLARFSLDGTVVGVDSTETNVHGIGCAPGSYVLVGVVPDLPVDLGGGLVPVGGFIVKRAKP